MSSGPNQCLTDEILELEETGSTTLVEILSKIEERTFREGLEIVEIVRTHYRLLTDSPKRGNQSQNRIWRRGPALGGAVCLLFRAY